MITAFTSWIILIMLIQQTVNFAHNLCIFDCCTCALCKQTRFANYIYSLDYIKFITKAKEPRAYF